MFNIITLIIIVIFIIMMAIICKGLITKINNKILFQPTKIKKHYSIGEIRKKYSHLVDCQISEFWIGDKKKIHSLYFNNPESKNIIIYCHGNAGNIIENIQPVHELYNFGSVLIFDYRGYGQSDGKPSEKGLYKDVYKVWKYANDKLCYKPNNIILWGMSLGCSVVLWLGQYLVKSNNSNLYPKLIIAQSGFYSLKRQVRDMFGIAEYFVVYTFDNQKYVRKINNKIPIVILHSPDDELIKYDHSIKLAKKNKCEFCEIIGKHNTNMLTIESINIIEKYIR